MKTALIAWALALGLVPAWSATTIPVAGSATGTWVDPQPADAVSTGVGSSTFQWGSTADGSVDNIFKFTGSSFDTVSGQKFKVGSLYYQNGSISSVGAASSVDLRLDMDFTTPALGHVVGDYTFLINNTANTGDPIASADFVTFPAPEASLSKAVFFTVGDQTYELDFAGFSNVVGDGFLQSTDAGFHVEEQGHATADVMAMVRPVPEPSTYALMLTGMAVIAGLSRRRRA